MKELASGAAVAIAVFGTGPYVVGMLRGRIRPHAFTWLVWTVTTMIAFAGQLVGNGGIGAAAAGASALVGVAISGYAFWRGGSALTRDSTGYVLQALLSHSSPGALPAARLPLSSGS